ncbi:venom allergen 5-like isoform X2 [Diabrotica virgifera virgifera]|uniref:Venom allergen 5-like isoform X2 n=1 Tax=Diabrotica virgifera virgifera TaxID=50390 RepID=A0A6P7FBR5_DIAVI|nr:venom allergen 5-like isoform X2 [Diabrotica virgifera virgifera]
MDRRIKLFYLLFVLYAAKAQTDYCKLSCGNTLQTVCERKNVSCGAATDCKNFKQLGLNDEERRYVLDLHNKYRNKVALGQEKTGPQPQASNMKALSYSKELEYIAQCHTNSCKYGHDLCRRTPEWGHVGQNIALKGRYHGDILPTREFIDWAMNGFYSEVRDWDPSWVSSYDDHGKEVGHYTNLVWARTRYVGCGLTFYVDEKGWDIYYLTCNYGEGGNIYGWSVYEVGPPASKCDGLPKNSKYPGLCGPDNL